MGRKIEVLVEDKVVASIDCGEWTKAELKIYEHGEIDLCLAVIEQWKKDGSPEQDRSSIDWWTSLVDGLIM